MVVNVDGQETGGRVFMVIAGNSEFAGGGSMRIAPGASLDDGVLNISIIKPVPLFRLLTKIVGCISEGTHINEPEVSYFKGKTMTVTSEPPTRLDLDGELFGTTPATFSVCPAALKILISKPKK
jgi:diacylglycerol kinase (ATP)